MTCPSQTTGARAWEMGWRHLRPWRGSEINTTWGWEAGRQVGWRVTKESEHSRKVLAEGGSEHAASAGCGVGHPPLGCRGGGPPKGCGVQRFGGEASTAAGSRCICPRLNAQAPLGPGWAEGVGTSCDSGGAGQGRADRRTDAASLICLESCLLRNNP